jgi:hypothetical protein
VLARSDRPEAWIDGGLQAALNEAARHGANERDLEQLRAQFQKAEDSKSQAEDGSRQAGDIPG